MNQISGLHSKLSKNKTKTFIKFRKEIWKESHKFIKNSTILFKSFSISSQTKFK